MYDEWWCCEQYCASDVVWFLKCDVVFYHGLCFCVLSWINPHLCQQYCVWNVVLLCIVLYCDVLCCIVLYCVKCCFNPHFCRLTKDELGTDSSIWTFIADALWTHPTFAIIYNKKLILCKIIQYHTIKQFLLYNSVKTVQYCMYRIILHTVNS